MNKYMKMPFPKHISFHTVYIVLLILTAALSSTITYFLTSHNSKKSLPTKQVSTTQDTTASIGQESLDLQQDNTVSSNAAQTPGVILHGPRDKKQIALTFDAEMTSYMKNQLRTGAVKSSYDKRIVDTLNQTQTKATFFLTGMWITLYPDVTQSLAKNPLFELGSHSYTDSSFSGHCYGLTELTETQKVAQVGETEFLLKIYGGIENMLFRFPGGCYSQSSLSLVRQASDTVVHWDVVGVDGFNNNTNQIINNVIDHVQNGSIIVLHLNGAPTAPKTADALPKIIASLKAKGYEFVKINELLNLPPETTN